jgi:hypothetical protein
LDLLTATRMPEALGRIGAARPCIKAIISHFPLKIGPNDGNFQQSVAARRMSPPSFVSMSSWHRIAALGEIRIAAKMHRSA